MENIALGESGVAVSRILMGTWQAGKKMWADIDDKQTVNAMRAAHEAGITAFDTATVYGDGHSERMVARALGDIREKVRYCTKVFPNMLAHDKVFAACHQSLRDLNTDYIDLYQIHWPAGTFGTPKVPIEESMAALNRLKEQGKIRAIGLSNFTQAQIAEARQYGEIVSLQPPYSLFWRQAEAEIIPYCQKNQMAVLAYSPMAQGILTGRFGPDHRFKKGDHRAKSKLFSPPVFEKVQQALEKLRPIAEKYAIALGQLALAWVLSHPGVCAIAGARNPEQITQSAKAASVRLEPADQAEMDAISQPVNALLDRDDRVMWRF